MRYCVFVLFTHSHIDFSGAKIRKKFDAKEKTSKKFLQIRFLFVFLHIENMEHPTGCRHNKKKPS
jgi:hypothetical protein